MNGNGINFKLENERERVIKGIKIKLEKIGGTITSTAKKNTITRDILIKNLINMFTEPDSRIKIEKKIDEIKKHIHGDEEIEVLAYEMQEICAIWVIYNFLKITGPLKVYKNIEDANKKGIEILSELLKYYRLTSKNGELGSIISYLIRELSNEMKYSNKEE